MNTLLIQQAIKQLSKLPGLGPRSGRRLALHLLKQRDDTLTPLINALTAVRDSVVSCEVCGNLDTIATCSLCQDPKRDHSTLCVVADVDDLWALERAGTFKGRYHVLGGVLSALDGVRPEHLRVSSLVQRVQTSSIQEVILALSTTMDAQTTAHYVQDLLTPHVSTISRLAQGVPMGGELDYLDDGTLYAAFQARVRLGGRS